ncbi:MAG: protein kinase domain-containing protein [Rhodoglobus sp.]
MRRQSSVPPELPGYTFVKLLGSGGFSDVFLYDQKLPRRRVAVKVLLTEDLTSASRTAFVAEANLMAQLSAHPYIVTIYQADVASDDRPYFVMEYCSGPSLAERYKSETFAVADALRTGVRLSSAVATAHGAGILHRDIKPANVLSNDYGWPALTDFGISSAVDDDALPVHTTTTITRGGEATGGTESQSIGMSVPWSPPEMFEDDPQPDVRSDVFSLAATIYTILAGQTPFEVRGRSNGTLDLIGRIERGAITPMTRDDIPRSLTAVLQKGMASNRNDRFATATDFARALQRVELELGYSPTTIEVPTIGIEAPVRGAEGEDDDATRARSVATIQAQPLPTPTPSAAARDQADATLVRGARNVVAQPDVQSDTIMRPRIPAQPEVAPSPEAPAVEPAEPKSLVGRVILWVSLGTAVLVAAAVALTLAFGGLPSPAPTPQATAKPGEVVVTDTIPTPELVGTPSEANGVVSVTVKNPAPEEGDAYVWSISNGPASEPSRRENTNTITVEGFTGEKVCIEISIVRAGQTSPNPLEVCYP